MVETGDQLRFALFFARKSKDGTEDDRAMSRFIVKNLAKSVLITNFYLMLIYFSLFKSYRNSMLLYLHLPATYYGIKFGLVGISPVLESYLFSKEVLPIDTL